MPVNGYKRGGWKTEAAYRRYRIKQVQATMPHPPVKHRPARKKHKRLPALALKKMAIRMVRL